MKAMKYVGLATLAAVTLGFATPASAAVQGVDETKVNVTVDESKTFKLVSVPKEFKFKTEIKDENYTLSIGSEEDPSKALEEEIKVFRGYTIKGATHSKPGTATVPITVGIGNLSVSQNDQTVGTVSVSSLSIAGKKLVGSGFGTFLTNKDFTNNTTGIIARDIKSAEIGFSKTYNTSPETGTADLQAGDKLTGQITYSINVAP